MARRYTRAFTAIGQPIGSPLRQGASIRNAPINTPLPRTGKFKPLVRRRVGAGPDLRLLLERRAFPESAVNGTLPERIVARQVSLRGYRFGFQEYVDGTAFNDSPKMDVSVYGTGLAPVIDLEVQGAYWHQDEEKDRLRRLQIEAQGIPVIFIWEADVIGSEDRMNYVIDEALRGIELPEPA